MVMVSPLMRSLIAAMQAKKLNQTNEKTTSCISIYSFSYL